MIGLLVLNTLCLFSYRQLGYTAYAISRPALLTFLEESAGGLAGLAVFPLIYLAAIRLPLLSLRWRRNLAGHLIALCLISAVHTTLIFLLRLVLFSPFGFSNESYGSLPVRYPMEFSHLFIYYWFAVSLIYFFHEVRFARDRELQAARLQTHLAEAQLQNLRLQIEPHFLFNALNSISAAIYESPRMADEMIGRLGELLRHLLKEDRSQLVSLAQELAMLRLYTRIMEARLEDRLSLRFHIDPAAENALVPQLILQPLVENAIRHGLNASFNADITIDAQIYGAMLCLRVADHGFGIDNAEPPLKRIGLSNTVARLQQLYGDDQTFELRNQEEGGAVAEIRIPLQLQIPAQEILAFTHAGLR